MNQSSTRGTLYLISMFFVMESYKKFFIFQPTNIIKTKIQMYVLTSTKVFHVPTMITLDFTKYTIYFMKFNI